MEDLFIRGVQEFNSQFFFEAHDVWEELWNETTDDRRVFYQGLIQTAVAFYHLDNGNFKGACSQFEKALGKLERYHPSYYGINTAALVRQVRACWRVAEQLRARGIGEFDTAMIPQIEFC